MAFNKVRKGEEKEAERLHKERLERCVPVAKELITLVANRINELPLGDDVQTSKEYDQLTSDILQFMLDKNVRWADKEFLFQLALQPLSYTQQAVMHAFTNSWQVAIAGLFGKTTNKLTMEDLDKALRRGEPLYDAEEKKDELTKAE